MYFEIKNIGKIKQADIELAVGVNVLTGTNNTGKSTFGKILFCVLDSFRNVKEEIQDGRQRGVYNSPYDLTDEQIQKSRITHRFKDRYGIPTVSINSQNKLGEVLLAIGEDRIKIYLNSDNKCVDYFSDLEIQHNVFYTIWHPIYSNSIKEKKSIKDSKINDILHLVDSVVGGDLERVESGGFEYAKSTVYFRETGSQELFKDSQVSSGLRLFLAVKGLLEYSEVQEHDVLIFDNPESDLHPEWQVILGEVIVLLQRAFSLTILLTTHSPYFLRAIEAFSGKHEVVSRYYYVTNENGFSNVQDVTKDTSIVYDIMTNPLQQLENIQHQL
jgi:predicted ATPase